MTNSKMYAAVTVEENNKYYSYVIPFSSGDNALYKLAVKGILHANIYKTRKDAAEVVTCWNNAHKANGDFMFDSAF